MRSFWNGFEKAAAEDPQGHHVRRLLLGNPISAAIEAKDGKKMDAFGQAFKHHLLSSAAGIGVGGLGGAGLGAGAGAIASFAKDRKIDPQVVKTLAVLGGMGGSSVGGSIGSLIGSHGRKASKIHGMHSKHKED